MTGSNNNCLTDDEYCHFFKIAVTGDSGVGKTWLVKRLAGKALPETSKATVGVELEIRTIRIDDEDVKVQLWDTAGQERYRAMTAGYYRGACSVFLVYDVTNEDSFNNIDKWMKECDEHAPEDVIKVLVGNKSDMKEEKVVDAERAKTYAASKGDIHFMEMSAKDNENIEVALFNIAKLIKDSKPKPQKQSQLSPIKRTTDIPRKKFGGCC